MLYFKLFCPLSYNGRRHFLSNCPFIIPIFHFLSLGHIVTYAEPVVCFTVPHCQNFIHIYGVQRQVFLALWKIEPKKITKAFPLNVLAT